jgi:hypothetical protein
MPSSYLVIGVLVRPSLARQGSLVIKQSLIPISREERGTHNTTSKLEGKSSLMI